MTSLNLLVSMAPFSSWPLWSDCNCRDDGGLWLVRGRGECGFVLPPPFLSLNQIIVGVCLQYREQSRIVALVLTALIQGVTSHTIRQYPKLSACQVKCTCAVAVMPVISMWGLGLGGGVTAKCLPSPKKRCFYLWKWSLFSRPLIHSIHAFKLLRVLPSTAPKAYSVNWGLIFTVTSQLKTSSVSWKITRSPTEDYTPVGVQESILPVFRMASPKRSDVDDMTSHCVRDDTFSRHHYPCF